MSETVFRNGRIVLPERISGGDVVVRGGDIVEIEDAATGVSGIDLEGDWLLPGLVELHTDHLEGHYAPRPKVRWNPAAALQAHDAQIAASGITTVFDALRVGMEDDADLTAEDMDVLGGAIVAAAGAGSLRADHFIHVRCEVSAPDVVDGFARFVSEPRVRLASLMDHTPGQRQFTSLEAYRRYFQSKAGLTDAEFADFVDRRQARAGEMSSRHRQAIAEASAARGIVLASHDDATADHVAEAVAIGIALAEFPTTMEAAEASRGSGLQHPDGGAEHRPRRLPLRQRRGTGAPRNLRCSTCSPRTIFPSACSTPPSSLPARTAAGYPPRWRWCRGIRPRRWDSTIAARSSRVGAPTWCGFIATAACRSSAASGARADASRDRDSARARGCRARATPRGAPPRRLDAAQSVVSVGWRR